MGLYFSVWRNFLNFSGRAKRSEYWVFEITNIVLLFVFLMIIGGLSSNYDESQPDPAMPFSIIYFLFVLGIMLPKLAVGVRRLHDTGKSGFWLMLGIIPYLGGIVLFFIMLGGSDPHDNKYGPAHEVDPDVFD
ncbi:MAG: DUF805 domain-containing protein [bacterium]|nr:DUF805 domain-containing protein [bacterium]